MSQNPTAREQAVHLLRAGQRPSAVARILGRSETWVRKCWRLYQDAGWAGLSEASRAPHHYGRRIDPAIRAAILQARSELEAAASHRTGLKYIGARAIRTRLQTQHLMTVPSVSTIERVIREAGMARPKASEPEVRYPRLRPQQPHSLIQEDLLPHYLSGGQRVFCFNAIDVVSRYPTGTVALHRRARDAVDFLVHVMQIIGIAYYIQVDNEGCFSGGATHPCVIGQCARLALQMGTELVFSLVRHPQSNGSIERFHQEYQRHVWHDTYLANVDAVQAQAAPFFQEYRTSRHHRALAGRTPQEVHFATAPRLLDATTTRSTERLPVTAGRLHFMRRVHPDGTVSVLNVAWRVPNFDVRTGVWVTVDLQPTASRLAIYDAAPDVPHRRCLVTYPFPVKEPVIAAERQQQPVAPSASINELQALMLAPVRLGVAVATTLWRQCLAIEPD